MPSTVQAVHCLLLEAKTLDDAELRKNGDGGYEGCCRVGSRGANWIKSQTRNAINGSETLVILGVSKTCVPTFVRQNHSDICARKPPSPTSSIDKDIEDAQIESNHQPIDGLSINNSKCPALTASDDFP